MKNKEIEELYRIIEKKPIRNPKEELRINKKIYDDAVKFNPENHAKSRYIGIISTRNKNPNLAMHEIPDYVFGTDIDIGTKEPHELKEILEQICDINPIFREVIADSERFHNDLHAAAKVTDIDINDYTVFAWGTLLEQGE